MNIGIVTCADFPLLTDQEKPLIDLFAAKDIRITPLVWNAPGIDWESFDGLILRSIWDYHLHVDDFFYWLDQLGHQNVRTFNSMEVVNWNRHKFYLRELAQLGVSIIPTLFFQKGTAPDAQLIKNQGWKIGVIKPAVSANAHLTESFSMDKLDQVIEQFGPLFEGRDWMVQSFMP
ncbi:MAG: RimK family alpha-L-glutamate ligase, partial [Cytophagales bacterium]